MHNSILSNISFPLSSFLSLSFYSILFSGDTIMLTYLDIANHFKQLVDSLYYAETLPEQDTGLCYMLDYVSERTPSATSEVGNVSFSVDVYEIIRILACVIGYVDSTYGWTPTRMLLLCFFEAMSAEDIAEILCDSNKSVSSFILYRMN